MVHAGSLINGSVCTQKYDNSHKDTSALAVHRVHKWSKFSMTVEMQ